MEGDEYTAVPSSAHPLVVDAEEYKSMARLPAQMTLKTPPPYSPSKLRTWSIELNFMQLTYNIAIA